MFVIVFLLKPYLTKCALKTLFNKTYKKLKPYLSNFYKYFIFKLVSFYQTVILLCLFSIPMNYIYFFLLIILLLQNILLFIYEYIRQRIKSFKSCWEFINYLIFFYYSTRFKQRKVLYIIFKCFVFRCLMKLL